MRAHLRLGMATGAAVTILACGFLQPAQQSVGDVDTIVAATLQAATLTAPTSPVNQPQPAGVPVEFPGGSLVIPHGLAAGASSEGIPAVAGQESAPGWDVAPAHTRITLQGYALQGKFHEPQIVIYPTEEYAAANDSAAQNIQRLRDLLSNPGTALTKDVMPHIPFFNAGAVFSAQPAVVTFAGGKGIRELTEYAQYIAPVNNTDMFYHFQGLTDDGKTYIVAVLPVTAPLLAAGSEPSSVPPPGGVPFPGYETTDESLFETYYLSVTNLLNSTSADQFQPTLSSLDAFIQSIDVSP